MGVGLLLFGGVILIAVVLVGLCNLRAAVGFSPRVWTAS